jgi:transcriptional antiterminator
MTEPCKFLFTRLLVCGILGKAKHGMMHKGEDDEKVLNNNVVIAERNKEEFILVGKAIGYDYTKGSLVPENKVENIFVKKVSKIGENYERILETVEHNVVGISEEIISLCESELKVRLNEAIHISLPDHINFAIRRIEQGVNIDNPFTNELLALYPVEYSLAVKALDMVNERLKSKLPESEAGFICLHIRAAMMEQDVSESLAYTRKISEVMELISELIHKRIDKNSLQYTRTVTHLKFMIERITEGKGVKNYLLDSIKKQMYNEYEIATKIAKKIEELFSVVVPDEEVAYVALHLRRLTDI